MIVVSVGNDSLEHCWARDDGDGGTGVSCLIRIYCGEVLGDSSGQTFGDEEKCSEVKI